MKNSNQVTLSLKLSSQWLLGDKASDKTCVQNYIDDGLWETMRTVLNNTFLKKGKMKNKAEKKEKGSKDN